MKILVIGYSESIVYMDAKSNSHDWISVYMDAHSDKDQHKPTFSIGISFLSEWAELDQNLPIAVSTGSIIILIGPLSKYFCTCKCG